MKRPVWFLGVVAVFGLMSASPAPAQEDPDFFKKPETPAEFWRALNFELNVGKFELAAAFLKGFLNSNPTEQDYLDIIEGRSRTGEGEYQGMAPFLRLRTVPVWSNNPQVQAEAQKNVEAVIQQAGEALRKRLGDPKRIARLAQQLTASPEEQAYAAAELRKSGVEAMPVLFALLEGNPTERQRMAILELLPTMDVATVPAQIAALDAADLRLKADLLAALRRRKDVTSLPARAETDPIPSLWYYASLPPGEGDVLREAARDFLAGLGVNPDRQRAEAALTEAARRFYRGEAKFLDPAAPRVWRYDPQARQLVPPPTPPYTPAAAEEYYGLRYARWALERAPDYRPARELALSLAADKAYLRFPPDTPLAQGAPEVYRLLATAPADLLLSMLDDALREERSTVVLATVQVLGDRGEAKAALPYARTVNGRAVVTEPLLVRALAYKGDPRIPFAAAEALLRIPGPPRHGSAGRVLDTLRRALPAAPAAGDDGGKKKALIGESDRFRAASLRRLLEGAGYEAAVVPTGRDLLRRLDADAGVEVVFVDQHLAAPLLPDLLAALRSDPRFADLPVVLVASPDEPRLPDLDTLLRRLALLVAATDEVTISTTAEPIDDPEGIAEGLRAERKSVDQQVQDIVADRLARLRRLVLSANLPLTERLGLRLEELTLRVAALELPRTPALVTRLQQLEMRRRAAPADPVPDEELYLRRLINLAGTIESEFPEALVQRVDRLRLAIAPAEEARVAAELSDPAVEARLERLARPYRRTHVIPEPYTPAAVRAALDVALAQAAFPPPTPEARKADALAALRWLSRMATGEVEGYDIRPVAPALREQLRSPDEQMASLAVRAVRHLPGAEAQQDLANLALDPDRPAPLRAEAARALVDHLQQFGRHLTPTQVRLLAEQAAGAAEGDLRPHLEAVVGIVTGSPAETSRRLLQYTPPAPQPPREPEAPPKEPKAPGM